MVRKADPRSGAAAFEEAWLIGQVRIFGSAAATAKALGLERTLVWRISKGRRISRSSVLEVRKSREAVAATNLTRPPQPAEELSVANLRYVLHYLLQALDALERDGMADARGLKK